MKPPSIFVAIRIGLLLTAITTNLFLIYFIRVYGLALFLSWLILFVANILLVKELMTVFLRKK